MVGGACRHLLKQRPDSPTQMTSTALLLLCCVGQAGTVPLPTVENDRSRIGIFSGGGNSGLRQYGQVWFAIGSGNSGRNQGSEIQGYQLHYDPELLAGHYRGDSNARAEGSRDHRNRLEPDRPIQAIANASGGQPIGVILNWTSGVVNRNSWSQEGSVIRILPMAGPGYVPPCFS